MNAAKVQQRRCDKVVNRLGGAGHGLNPERFYPTQSAVGSGVRCGQHYRAD